MQRLALIFTLACLAAACGDATGTTAGSSTSGGSTDASAADPTTTGSGPGSTTGLVTGDPPDPACPLGLLDCAGTCVDVAHDSEHCGGCGEVCADGLACLDGACAVACGPGASVCGRTCTLLAVDPAHCGSCDHACAPGVACVAGACAPVCAAGEAACGEACVDLQSDEAHCGACDTTCPAGQPCVFGRCVDAAIHHLLIAGQSLSVGAEAKVVSTKQPYGNLSFNTGVRAGGMNLTDFILLVETTQFINASEHGETIASGAANLVAELELARGVDHVILASAHGAGGQPYVALKRGTPPYTAGMAQVVAGAAVSSMLGEPYAVRAVALIHGESDHINNNLTYAENLLEWQSDYEADVQALTGQPHPVPMFLCQMSSWTMLKGTTSRIPGEQLAAAAARPDRIFVVGPKYFLPYVDGVHLTGDGERWLGEHYAKVYRRVLIDGEPWRPLQPAEVTREGAVITVRFDVPAPPLVLDEEHVTNPGNYGFEYTDASGAPPAIAAVTLVDAETVRVTLAVEPIAGNRRLRYAYTGKPMVPAGPTTGPRGNLRDSDATPSRHGYLLHNWAVHFDVPVP
jgi:hypothetical protein